MDFLRRPFRRNLEQPQQPPENYWLEIARKIYEETGKIPTRGEIQAWALINALGIPFGPYSAIEIPRTKKSIERDKIIAAYLTNIPGVIIEGETLEGEKYEIVSLDPRDIYPEGLPGELKNALDEETREYLEAEYKHQAETREMYKKTRNWRIADCPLHCFRLPGGINLILRGYIHDPEWQEAHGSFLREANRFPRVICVEGPANIPFGERLEFLWRVSGKQDGFGHYDVLMREAVENGFSGLFAEVDPRFKPSPLGGFDVAENLPYDFWKHYFDYLKRLFPWITEWIKSPQKLKEILAKLSTTEEGIFKRITLIFHKGKIYSPFPYVDREGKTSFEPTGLELGLHLFGDALAALRLYLIARLMADGHIPRGLIVYYQGLSHISSTTFFLRHPVYAAEVVLRTAHHLTEEKIKEEPQAYEVFRTPNREEIVREIARLVFKKPVEQRELRNYPVDYLGIYGIDPARVLPSDEEIEKIIKELNSLRIV